MELIIILILILLNGVFAMSEIAIVSARKAKLEIDSKKGDKKAKLALEIAESPNRFLSTVQIGITLIGILNGVFGGAAITSQIKAILDNYAMVKAYSESIAVGVVVVFITYLSLVLGELIPKRIGMAYSTSIAKVVAHPMNLLSKFTAPFIWLLSSSSTFVLKVLGIKTDLDTPITEEEIRAMVEEGTTHGSVDEIEHEIVERVFDLGNRKVGSLMTPRHDVVWLDISNTFEEVREIIKNNAHSVFLLSSKNIDHILGVITLKDLLPVYVENSELNLDAIKKKVLFVTEHNKAYDVLERFKKSKVHFAAVVDEYGTLAGIVTINDIINAIVGDISATNEFGYEIVEREDGSFLIDAQIPFEDFLDHFEIENFNRSGIGNFHSLGGFILSIIKNIPKAGEKFMYDDFNFEIMDMDGNRIDKVLVSRIENANK
jgi:putative hemolysin